MACSARIRGPARNVRAAFEDVRPLFEHKLRQLDLLDDEPDLWETAYNRVREVEAWCRWNDEPFP